MSEAMESSLIPEETPAEEIPVAETPTEEIPAEETPVSEPAPEQPVEEAPAPAEPQTQPEPPVMPAPAKPQKVRKIKRSRPWPLKILMELIAIILCLTLFVVTIVGALVMDLRVMTSKDGFEKILTELITSTMSQPGNSAEAPAPNGSVTLLSNTSAASVSNPITDMVYDMLQDQFGQDLPLSKEEVSDFINNSTVKDFVADKVSGAFDDFINGTSNTTITKDEIVDLVKDNAPLIKETFGIEITEDQLGELESALDEVPILEELEKDGLMGFLEDNYLDADKESGDMGIAGNGGLADGLAAVKQIREYVQIITSNTALYSIAGVLAVLMLLILLVNWTLPKTLSDIGITLLFAGLILSSVNFVAASGVLQIVLADQAAVIGLVTGILSSIAVVHYSILGTGAALILLAIVAKIIKSHRRKALQAAF